MSHVTNVMVSVEPSDRSRVEALSQWLQTSAPRRGSGPDTADTLWGWGKHPECDVYSGVLNHADLLALVAQVERVPWQHPEFVQLLVMGQEQLYFRMWMFHGPVLRQIAPDRREEAVSSAGGLPDIHTRFALADDADLLRDTLVAAVNWTPGRDVPREAVLGDPHNAHYVDGWPRPGDLGVVAVAAWENNRWAPTPVGAAWLRYFTEDDPGYGFVGDDVPELSISVGAAQRGRGVGTMLIRRLLKEARDIGIERVSLSVERANPAMRLYEREGFRVHDPCEGQDSLTMIISLR